MLPIILACVRSRRAGPTILSPPGRCYRLATGAAQHQIAQRAFPVPAVRATWPPVGIAMPHLPAEIAAGAGCDLAVAPGACFSLGGWCRRTV